ncbi:uncharacterized protein PGTG_11793 [Puccinia graminis f. sp. tritici CRL 75-36-700-3]|uniref:Leucine carboxyl methyltransferase 1 n=1 Tax=Puccinia graminis f. sp. tritici (strain CRL 75-36-700-3 / race SCCL) TaxID=418459 RepID=E3KMB2_PUCGT|nr:uncharacterized protein PGTG_11793 [Puccinia graminis f. sp. tritici CRL 75-36-700-3]EFP85437.1 hypothetical protein PGTG_11793 [Puccinia graminis f. sp. tritici CRL 75-36-700-3]
MFSGSRGRGRGGSRSSRTTAAIDPDRTVRETDIDASVARLSAISKNYIQDEYAELLMSCQYGGSQEMMIRRPPWVNIGTHHRTYLIDELVSSFLGPPNHNQQEQEGEATTKQVLSLGAGSDSRFWRLKSRFDRENHNWPNGRWVETDLQPTVTTKIEKIVSSEKLRQVCGEDPIVLRSDDPDPTSSSDRPPTELHSPHYSLLSTDLRRPTELVAKLSGPDPTSTTSGHSLLCPETPTLIIAELVFLYLSPTHTHACLQSLVNYFRGPLMIICYEALDLEDNFSKMMVQNLATRGLSMAGFEANRSIDSQIQRFKEHGFTEIVCTDIKALRTRSFPGNQRDGDPDEEEGEGWKARWSAELDRIRKLEFLDEVEELELILLHYALSWARKNFILPSSSSSSTTNATTKSTVGFYLPKF